MSATAVDAPIEITAILSDGSPLVFDGQHYLLTPAEFTDITSYAAWQAAKDVDARWRAALKDQYRRILDALWSAGWLRADPAVPTRTRKIVERDAAGRIEAVIESTELDIGL